MISWVSMSNPYKQARRIKLFVFNADILIEHLSAGNELISLQGWKVGAEPIKTIIDPVMTDIMVIVEHPDFPLVESNVLIPVETFTLTEQARSCYMCRFCTSHADKLVCFHDEVKVYECDMDFWCKYFQEKKDGELET